MNFGVLLQFCFFVFLHLTRFYTRTKVPAETLALWKNFKINFSGASLSWGLQQWLWNTKAHPTKKNKTGNNNWKHATFQTWSVCLRKSLQASQYCSLNKPHLMRHFTSAVKPHTCSWEALKVDFHFLSVTVTLKHNYYTVCCIQLSILVSKGQIKNGLLATLILLVAILIGISSYKWYLSVETENIHFYNAKVQQWQCGVLFLLFTNQLLTPCRISHLS